MPAHSTLSGADLHETKGADSASANTVLTATGTGTAQFKKVNSSMIDTASIFDTNKAYVSYPIALISSATDYYIPVPGKCIISKVSMAVGNTFTVSDLSVNVYNGVSNLGTFTIPSAGSSTGTSGFTVPAATVYNAGSVARVTTSAVTGSVNGFVVVEFTLVV